METSLGKTLRTAREASGITVDDAVYLAKMPRAVVEALEADDLGFFTSPLYARSFLRQYGEYIGVDVGRWIDDIEQTPLIDSEAVEAFIDLSVPDPAPVKKDKAKQRNPGGGAMAAVWMLLITGGIVWGGIEFFKTLDKKLSIPAPGPEQAEKTAAGQDEPAPEKPAEKPAEKPVASSEPDTPKRAIIVNLPEE